MSIETEFQAGTGFVYGYILGYSYGTGVQRTFSFSGEESSTLFATGSATIIIPGVPFPVQGGFTYTESNGWSMQLGAGFEFGEGPGWGGFFGANIGITEPSFSIGAALEGAAQYLDGNRFYGSVALNGAFEFGDPKDAFSAIAVDRPGQYLSGWDYVENVPRYTGSQYSTWGLDSPSEHIGMEVRRQVQPPSGYRGDHSDPAPSGGRADGGFGHPSVSPGTSPAYSGNNGHSNTPDRPGSHPSQTLSPTSPGASVLSPIHESTPISPVDPYTTIAPNKPSGTLSPTPLTRAPQINPVELDTIYTSSITHRYDAGYSVPSGGIVESIGRAVSGIAAGIGSAISGIGHAIGSALGAVGHAISGIFGGNTSNSSSGSGHSSKPVLLDLDGNGISVDPLNASNQFLDLDGDGFLTRTAWAGKGDGVLVLDADGSKTTTRVARDCQGAISFINIITVSADGLSTTTTFDDNGDGIIDRRLTDVSTILANGSRQRVVSSFNARWIADEDHARSAAQQQPRVFQSEGSSLRCGGLEAEASCGGRVATGRNTS